MSKIDEIAKAIRDADISYSLMLTKLIDEVRTYELVIHGDCCVREFPGTDEAYEYIAERRDAARARAAVEALRKLREPTEAMLCAARDWSIAKNGIGLGDDQATGCWQAMLDGILK